MSMRLKVGPPLQFRVVRIILFFGVVVYDFVLFCVDAIGWGPGRLAVILR